MDISIGINSHHRPRGNGFAVRVVEMPVYTYVDSLNDLDMRLREALQLWCAGFPTTDELLRYLDDNGVFYTVGGVPSRKWMPSSEWTPVPHEYRVAVPA